jgi:hypothetical protein
VLPCLLILVVLGLVVFVGYMVFGGSGRMKDRLRDEVGPQYLRETITTLLPWDSTRAIADIASRVKGRKTSSGLGPWSHSRGTVQSLNNARDAWLAYTVDTQRRLGRVSLHTSSHRIIIDVRSAANDRGRREALITIDGRALGSVLIDRDDVLDAHRQPLGHLSRGRTLIMQGMTNYRTLTIGGRNIAEVNFEPLGPLDRPGPPPPAFRVHQPALSHDEQWWLVALLGIALYKESLSSDV